MRAIAGQCRLVLLGLAAVLASACGGGGGGGAPAATTPPPPALPTAVNAQQAWANLMSQNSTYTASATISGNAYTAQFNIANNGTTTGTPVYNLISISQTVSENGTFQANDSFNLYTDTSNSPYAFFDLSGGFCSFPTNVGVPPTSAAINQGGLLFNADTIYSSTSASQCSTSLIGNPYSLVWNWSIMGDASTGIAYFCVDVSRNGGSPQSNCVEVSASGKLGTHSQIIVPTSSGNVTLSG